MDITATTSATSAGPSSTAATNQGSPAAWADALAQANAAPPPPQPATPAPAPPAATAQDNPAPAATTPTPPAPPPVPAAKAAHVQKPVASLIATPSQDPQTTKSTTAALSPFAAMLLNNAPPPAPPAKSAAPQAAVVPAPVSAGVTPHAEAVTSPAAAPPAGGVATVTAKTSPAPQLPAPPVSVSASASTTAAPPPAPAMAASPVATPANHAGTVGQAVLAAGPGAAPPATATLLAQRDALLTRTAPSQPSVDASVPPLAIAKTDKSTPAITPTGAPDPATPVLAAAPAANAPAIAVTTPATPAALAAAVTAMHQGGQTSTVLRLDPAGLGNLAVHVSLAQNGQVNVLFVPSTAPTAQLLHAGMDGFRQSMAANGISLGQAQVGGQSGNSANQGQPQPRQTFAAPVPPAASTTAGLIAYA